jgi:tRNA-intron endonuclease
LLKGEIVNSKIIVKRAKDIGKLYYRSNFGKLLDNGLELNLLEGAFLLEEGKIKIFKDKEELGFEDIIRIAEEKIAHFSTKYRIYKDLRKRGYTLRISEEEEGFYHEQNFISAFSERDILNLQNTKDLVKRLGKDIWFAIVDEEGDITYYTVSLSNPKGEVEEGIFPKGEGFYSENSVILFDHELSKALHTKEFFGKSFGKGLQLSMVEALYLSEKGILKIKTTNGERITLKRLKKEVKEMQPDIMLRLAVFKDLKRRGLIVKTGFKFGAHFRAYSKHPDKTHAEYLIHVPGKEYQAIWSEISRAVRLAHSVNKEIAFALVNRDKIEYIRFGRLRP